MTFTWPWALLGLLTVPLLVGAYRRLVRSRAQRRDRLAQLGIVAPGQHGGVRRHVAPVLLVTALTLLLVAVARPQATVSTPVREGTVILAFDTSSSMIAKDVAPTRMAAAQAAAREFINRQPPEVKVGVVAFGEGGLVVQQPTKNRADALQAVARLSPAGGTSLGRGIQTALSAIAGRVVEIGDAAGGGGLEPTGPDIGFYRNAAVVLLSDGENTAGPDPVPVADIASAAGVRIYPVGLGSPEGTVVRVDGFQLATKLDEPVLQQIAQHTDGRYFQASDAAGLRQVYRSIDLQWQLRPERVELTGALAGLAALLLLVGSTLSFVWFGRVV